MVVEQKKKKSDFAKAIPFDPIMHGVALPIVDYLFLIISIRRGKRASLSIGPSSQTGVCMHCSEGRKKMVWEL